jgi:hypothetical protein
MCKRQKRIWANLGGGGGDVYFSALSLHLQAKRASPFRLSIGPCQLCGWILFAYFCSCMCVCLNIEECIHQLRIQTHVIGRDAIEINGNRGRFGFMNMILELSFLIAFINHMSDEVYGKTSHWFHIRQLETRFLPQNNKGRFLVDT